MPLFRHVLSRLSEDLLLVVLLVALGPLLWTVPEHVRLLPALVDWKTIAALTGLMVLSRSLEDSGYLAHAGHWLLARIQGERTLAGVLVLFSAGLSSVITNDVALFIVVPLTLSLRLVADLPIGRLAVFEALAVNAGSAVSPVGNPQNLFLWQSSRATFLEFIAAMLPLAACLLMLLVALIPLGFPKRRIELSAAGKSPPLQRELLWMSLALYPIFLVLTDLGWAVETAGVIVVLYMLCFRRVVLGVDWLLLVVFVLMFVDLGLLARLPAIGAMSGEINSLPGGIFTAGVLLSQLISNVPAAIFLEAFSDDWRALAWGVSVGGFGLAIGSLANLIALRLARQPGLWRDFHRWSLPMLAGGYAIATALGFVAT